MKKIIAAVAVAAALALTGCSSSAPTVDAVGTGKAATVTSSKASPKVEPVAKPKVEPVAKPKVAAVPTEYKSALKSAENYNTVLPMSKAGLFAQLTSTAGDKFSEKAAQYAIDNIKADWNANALKSAKNYQDMMAMSPEAIREQLTSNAGDKYTAEQADYAVKHLG